MVVISAAASMLDLSPAAECSGLDGQPCGPKLSRVFHHRFHGFDVYPFSEALQLTIYSTAEQAPASGPEKPDAGQALDTVGDLFAALRSCWVAPAQDEARAGMEMTVRFALKRNGEMIAPPRATYATRSAPAETRDIYLEAIMGALERCMPLPLSEGFASDIAGVPIAVRFVDDRKLQ